MTNAVATRPYGLRHIFVPKQFLGIQQYRRGVSRAPKITSLLIGGYLDVAAAPRVNLKIAREEERREGRDEQVTDRRSLRTYIMRFMVFPMHGSNGETRKGEDQKTSGESTSFSLTERAVLCPPR